MTRRKEEAQAKRLRPFGDQLALFLDEKLDNPQGSLDGQSDLFGAVSMDGLDRGLGDEDGNDSDGPISLTS
jgi:hypothetical protein